MSGVSVRSQYGYEWTIVDWWTSLPSVLRRLMMSLSQSLQKRPAYSGKAEVNAQASSSGSAKAFMPFSRQTRKSSSPYAGAMWTRPVPSSVVT